MASAGSPGDGSPLAAGNVFRREALNPGFLGSPENRGVHGAARRLAVPDPFRLHDGGGKRGYPGEERHDFDLTHEWLAQSATYLVYAAGGFPAIVLLRALLVAGACFL